LAKKKEYLLVDGYNIIHAWGMMEKPDDSLEDARKTLIDILADYQGSIEIELIIVFDAHKVIGNVGSIEQYGNAKIVYTKEAETADNYIERVTHNLTKDYIVRVATSDNLEQIIILGKGALRLSARELKMEVDKTKKRLREEFIDNRPIKNNLLLDNLDSKTVALLEFMRRQKGG